MEPAEVMEFLGSLPVSKWGVAELNADLHPLGARYRRGISLVMASPVRMDAYDEGRFRGAWEGTHAAMERVLSDLRGYLEEQRIEHLAPRGQDEETLIGTFSHKLAATRAGLGWIGKSTLLVTKEYGPCVRVVTVLVEADLPCGQPVTRDYCGECRACVDACIYGCIKNVAWYPGIDRAEMLDVHLCNAKRSELIPVEGRKHECGLCMIACPVGRT